MKIIKKLRADKGITLKQLADATGLSVSLLNGYELGQINNPKFSTIEALANFFKDNSDLIHKEGKRIPRDIFFAIVDGKLSFNEIREVLNVPKI